MFKFLLQGDDFNWMAIFGLITFVVLFVIVLIAVFVKDSASMNRMAQMPLDDDDEKAKT